MAEEQSRITFEQIKSRVRGVALDGRRVLTVPVWGWTGDGKTCSILTLYHYVDPVDHGLGIALVNDTSELESVVAGVPEYESLRLPELARATSDRLSRLAEVFLDGHRWPPGTDAPTPYLLRLSGVRETLGHLFLPDLQGGSYQAAEGPARAVLAEADGCVILVDAEKYSGSDVESRKYRREVDYRVQGCVTSRIPAAVMIAKVDLSLSDHAEAVDATHTRLTLVVDGAENINIFRVSVLGEEVGVDDDGQPPPVEQRNPAALLRAWAWLLSEVLIQSVGRERRVPPVRLTATSQQAVMSVRRVPEIRNLGTFSGPPGRVVGSAVSRDGPAFLLLDGDNLVVATANSGGDKPGVQALGSVIGLTDLEDVDAVVSGEEVFLGSRFFANALWNGLWGDDLVKVDLPVELVCWCVTAGRRVAGVDSSGRVHLFERQGNRWQQVSFVADFVDKSERYVCAWLPRERALVVANGAVTCAVEVKADGFGDRLSVPINLVFGDGDTARISPVGLAFAHPRAEDFVSCSFGGTLSRIDVNPLLEESATAVGVDASTIAVVDVDLFLHVIKFMNSKHEHVVASTSLSGVPTGMAWGFGGATLLVTFEDSWSVYGCRGFDE